MCSRMARLRAAAAALLCACRASSIAVWIVRSLPRRVRLLAQHALLWWNQHTRASRYGRTRRPRGRHSRGDLARVLAAGVAALHGAGWRRRLLPTYPTPLLPPVQCSFSALGLTCAVFRLPRVSTGDGRPIRAIGAQSSRRPASAPWGVAGGRV